MELTRELLDRSKPLMGGKTPKDILLEAFETIEDENNWTPWDWALDSDGKRVPPQHEDAVRWSLESAISKACGDHGIVPPYFIVLLDITLKESYGFQLGIAYFEQHMHHQEVLSFIGKALERSECVTNETK